MKITKMHGAGNDFILINNVVAQLPQDVLESLAIELCQRRTSVGGDGLILADLPQEKGHVRMVFFNADGSRGEMCGNGARCLARFAYEEGLAPEEMILETPAGEVLAKRKEGNLYWVRLPNPSILERRELLYRDEVMEVGYVELGQPGVPHLCVPRKDLESISSEELLEIGRELRHHHSLHKGANVNFYQKLSSTHYLEKTYERGVEDFTMACGTGSASVALILQKMHPALRNQRIKLTVPGGDLWIEAMWSGEHVHSVDLMGPTRRVFDGQYHSSFQKEEQQGLSYTYKRNHVEES